MIEARNASLDIPHATFKLTLPALSSKEKMKKRANLDRRMRSPAVSSQQPFTY